MNDTQALHDLEKDGYFIWDHFLSESELLSLQQDFHTLHEDQKFTLAGIGQNFDFHLSPMVRNDETCWFEPLSLNSAQTMLWDKLEVLKKLLNKSFFFGLWSLEAHYSHYPVNGMYQAHKDRFSQDDTRTISIVIYLNQNWNQGDGGELRIFRQNQLPIDILPTGGRLVCFLSADILHEVLLTKQSRYSFSGWWKRRT